MTGVPLTLIPLIKEHNMVEKKKIIITSIKDLPDYEKRGYNSEQIIEVSNNTTGQQQHNTDQSQADDKDKGK